MLQKCTFPQQNILLLFSLRSTCTFFFQKYPNSRKRHIVLPFENPTLEFIIDFYLLRGYEETSPRHSKAVSDEPRLSRYKFGPFELFWEL